MNDTSEAYKKALRLLAVRGRFRRELEERLSRDHFSKEAIAEAVDRCAKAGYLDDDERGRLKIASKARKGYGAKRVHRELCQHLDGDQVDTILKDYDEKEALDRYLSRHPKLLKDPKAKMKLFRRGFDLSTIHEVFAKYTEFEI